MGDAENADWNEREFPEGLRNCPMTFRGVIS